MVLQKRKSFNALSLSCGDRYHQHQHHHQKYIWELLNRVVNGTTMNMWYCNSNTELHISEISVVLQSNFSRKSQFWQICSPIICFLFHSSSFVSSTKWTTFAALFLTLALLLFWIYDFTFYCYSSFVSQMIFFIIPLPYLIFVLFLTPAPFPFPILNFRICLTPAWKFDRDNNRECKQILQI